MKVMALDQHEISVQKKMHLICFLFWIFFILSGGGGGAGYAKNQKKKIIYA
jgi:hypothetical protein